MFEPHPDDLAPLATMSDSVREWAANVGWHRNNVTNQWLLHDYDVWTRNPHYTGPDQGHPDDDYPTPEQLAAKDYADRCAYWDGK
jgi:hypothetical protein